MKKKPYAEYREDIETDIKECLARMQCQPILFIGSGFSRRYLGAPDWHGLLREVAKICPAVEFDYAYFQQSTPDPEDIATVLADRFHKWAWGAGKNEFPTNIADGYSPKAIYLKYKVAAHLQAITPQDVSTLSENWANELDALRSIHPHAIITTNYDELLEKIFPEYVKVVGQSVLAGAPVAIGEILKIHGCVTDPASLVLVRDDYSKFVKTAKYLSAKLLTYFAEHPLVFIGYSATDQNVRNILSDLDMILSPEGRVIQNVYLLKRQKDVSADGDYAYDELISVEDGRNVRIKCIVASDFTWVYAALAHRSPMTGINVKTLRALSARMDKIIRSDLTTHIREINYATLTALIDDDKLPAVLGIGKINDAASVNFHYPYVLTEVGVLLGGKSWHIADKFIKKIEKETGINIRKSDNQYHIEVKSGNKSATNKYSVKAVELLIQVRDAIPYSVELKTRAV